MEEHKNVPPMEQRRLVTYINDFITSTVTFLNDFITHSEAKMMQSEQRLQKISASLCILEAKLNSVPELQELEAQQALSSELSIKKLKEDCSTITEIASEPKKTEDNIIQNLIKSESPVDEPTVDPAILKYRKMLQFGVPRGAVELKMVHEGLDPKLL